MVFGSSALAASMAATARSNRSSATPARQAEHAFGDDVALDLRRPTRDRARERPQVLHRPRPLTPHRRPGARVVEPVGTERLDRREIDAALSLAGEQLE